MDDTTNIGPLLWPDNYSCAPAFAHTCGPRDAKCVLVGEAWGENEDMFKVPLVGWSGQELARLLHESGHVAEPPPDTMGSTVDSLRLRKWWDASGILTTNVFAFRPPDNNLQHDSICGKKAEVGADYVLPPLKAGKYVRPRFLSELDRLREEIGAHPRNLVVAMGATATWALLRDTRIGAIRGAVTRSTRFDNFKTLPTYHPAAILRQWAWRPILLADLMKAKRERDFPDVRRPERYALVAPTLAEAEQWTARTLAVIKDWKYGLVPRCTLLSIDIETFQGQIESIAFAPSRGESLTIPLIDKTKPGWSYWPTAEAEFKAWKLIRALCESSIKKLFQNGLFDLQYLWRAGIRPRGCDEDAMVLHHALYPEMQKGLAFLGSIYTNEAAWKLMRRRGREEFKRDE